MMMTRRSLITLVGLAVLALSALAVYAYDLRRRADDLIRISFELSQRRNPPTTQELRRLFGGSLKQSNICEHDGCGYDVELNNRILAILRLTPYASLTSSFRLAGDVLKSNDVQFWTRARQGEMVLSSVLIRYCDRCSFFRLTPDSSSTLSATGYLDIGSGSPPANLRMALGVDTGCLTPFHGCVSIAELIPSVWRRTSAQTIQCRIPTRDGDVIDGH